jgi:UDP-N-acetyl-D-mannosaminuronic acid dehydrogenase
MKIVNTEDLEFDICVVGGAGHVGLPLAMVFASKKLRVLVYDINKQVLQTIQRGKMPFMEQGAEPLLKRVLAAGTLTLSSDPTMIAKAKTVIITVGTPVDEFLNPVQKLIKQCIDDWLPYFGDDKLLVLRSTVYPGTTDWLANYLQTCGKHIKVAFCPERVVQGRAIEEVQSLPQIVSGITAEAEELAAQLFSLIAASIVRLSPMEAEFAKLFSNAYRYIEFAIANQFYMITHSVGLNFHRILDGMKKDYPRLHGIARPGLTAGPCLFKDTMQLAAFSNNQFALGHSAMLINEGLVLYLVNEMAQKYDLSQLTVGLLGMAFKADNDDIRSSLSYKLKKVLAFRAKKVLTTDPHVTVDPELLSLESVIEQSNILVLCVPHTAYRQLEVKNKPVFDIWNFLSK